MDDVVTMTRAAYVALSRASVSATAKINRLTAVEPPVVSTATGIYESARDEIGLHHPHLGGEATDYLADRIARRVQLDSQPSR